MQKLNKLQIFSAFTLKIFACIFMAVDHIGVRIYPDNEQLRIIGRLAFPIFAYFIAEGCRYTRSKLKRFLSVFLLGIFCEAFYISYSGEYYGNILITFSISILLIYLLQAVKRQLNGGKMHLKILSLVAFAAALVASFLFCRDYGVDYGFAGVLVPLLVSLPDYKEGEAPRSLCRFDKRYIKLILLAVGLLLVVMELPFFSNQLWSLAAIPLIALYNGKVGRFKFKYGFYIFYPAHLAIIEMIAMLQ